MDNNIVLTIMVALHCEAKPIIDAYKLKKLRGQPFDHYCCSESVQPQIELVISGIGALAMATAVGWIGAYKPNRKRAWLNVGTAGHEARKLGDLFLVHGVGDEVAQRSHYPAMVAKWAGPTEAVLSVSTPSDNYPGGAAVDMEAYAFFNSALRFSDSEIVQSLKVVSDNRLSGIEHLNAAKLTEFMANNVVQIMSYIEALLLLVRPDFLIDYDVESLFALRGTHSQRLQVTQALQKLQAMNGIGLVAENVVECRDLGQVIKVLQLTLDSVVPTLIQKNCLSNAVGTL